MRLFKIEADKLKEVDIAIVKAIYREGTKHMKYFHSTMSIFKNPANRVKTHDTLYYEEILPYTIEILKNKGELK